MYLPCPPRLDETPDGFQWFAWRSPTLAELTTFLNLNEVIMPWANHVTADGDYVSASFLYPVKNRPLAYQYMDFPFPLTIGSDSTLEFVFHRKGVRTNPQDKYPQSGDITITCTIPAATYANLEELIAACNNGRPEKYQTAFTLEFGDGTLIEGDEITANRMYLHYYADVVESIIAGITPSTPGWSAITAVDNSDYVLLDPSTYDGTLRRDELPANWDLIENPVPTEG